ncbi:hypothetical protein [Endozoicomonas ascidiicola]|uniref:hypothetical protein n=1 Tax=Endozoicomonas ascidiicola TaxID=1698521 RepID=UPI000833BA17|nr:hypothetical protein [Endozoicomonas ascidiicola]
MSQHPESQNSGKFCISIFDDKRFNRDGRESSPISTSSSESTMVDNRFSSASNIMTETQPHSGLYASSDDRFAQVNPSFVDTVHHTSEDDNRFSAVAAPSANHSAELKPQSNSQNTTKSVELNEEIITRIVKEVLNRIPQ